MSRWVVICWLEVRFQGSCRKIGCLAGIAKDKNLIGRLFLRIVFLRSFVND